MLTLEHITVIISLVVAGISMLTFVFARFGDHGKREHWQGQTTAQLGAISEDVKDMKAQQRNYDKQLLRTQDEANKALGMANAAHVRLDMIGAPSAYCVNDKQRKDDNQ